MEIGVVGDVVLTGAAWTTSDSRFTPDVRDACWARLAGCAMVLANLEAPITTRLDPTDRKPYNFRFIDGITALFDERFVLGLANNHIMDYGTQGLADTIAALDRAGIAYAGAGVTLDRARAPHYRRVAGVETAVLCAADPRFTPATASTAGTFPARPGLLAESVTEARRRARCVAVTMHMGLEHASTPSGRQVDLAEEALNAGAQLVAFHHAHQVGGYSRTNSSLVLWSTGNYIFKGLHDLPGATRRTAAWRVRYSESADAVTGLSLAPASIDSDGIPRDMTADRAGQAKDRIERYSRRVKTPWRRRIWRALEMVNPRFLQRNTSNYLSLLRLRGPRFVLRSLLAGLRAQLTR